MIVPPLSDLGYLFPQLQPPGPPSQANHIETSGANIQDYHTHNVLVEPHNNELT